MQMMCGENGAFFVVRFPDKASSNSAAVKYAVSAATSAAEASPAKVDLITHFVRLLRQSITLAGELPLNAEVVVTTTILPIWVLRPSASAHDESP